MTAEPDDEWDAPAAEPISPSRGATKSRSNRGGRKKSKPKRELSTKVKEAILGLAVGGILFGVFGGMGVYLINTSNIDALGRTITYWLLAVGIGGFIAACAVWQRVPGAKYLAMFVLAFFALSVPLGTIVAYITFQGLSSCEMERYLAGR